MSPYWIWVGALTLYALFTFWYVNWSGPLTTEEIDRHLATLMASAEEISPEREAVFRKFLEADDGGEFFMVNLARLPREPIADPETGAMRPAPEVLREYTSRFLPGVFRRAGHPAFFGRSAGSYIEQWGVEPDPGWSFAGVVRYRSRRDLMEVATDPNFTGAHAFKLVAMSHTLAFPVAPGFSVLGPRIFVGLLLALLAALVHIFFGARG